MPDQPHGPDAAAFGARYAAHESPGVERGTRHLLEAAAEGFQAVRGGRRRRRGARASGSRTFFPDAYLLFVNTDPHWRRRGVGLSNALDASGPGTLLYRRPGITALDQDRTSGYSRGSGSASG